MDISRLVLFSGICFLIFNSSSGAVETIDVHQAKYLLEDSGYTYIDVRTNEEFNKGHVDVKNILNIPYMFSTPEGRVINPQFLEQILSACNKEDKLILGCQSGVRSVHASVVLLEAEFKHIKNMGGGYAAWVENGLPVKKTKLEL